MCNDDEKDLPKWFVEDEKRYSFIQLPVTKEEVETQRKIQAELDARPAKKVLQAKARKMMKAKRALNKQIQKVKNEGGVLGPQNKLPSLREMSRKKEFRWRRKKKQAATDQRTNGEKYRSWMAAKKAGKRRGDRGG